MCSAWILISVVWPERPPLEKIQQDTERDNYLTAQQAKEYGLIDEVIPTGKPL